MLDFVLGIAATLIAFCLFMLYRNHYVYRYRTRVLHESSPILGECLRNHDKLPSYDAMLWQLTKFNWDEYWKS